MERFPILLLAAMLPLTVGCTAQTSSVSENEPQSGTVSAGSVDTAAATVLPLAGVQYRGNWGYTRAERTELLAKLSAHGVEWLRIGVRWASIQPDRPTASDPGRNPRALARTDRIIREAHVRGFRVSVTFNSTPNWANGGRGPKVPPRDPSDYARAAAWMAKRYRGQVQSWEIYNEPNNERMMQATPATYVPVLCAAYRAIHRAAPKLRVVTGGTSGNDWKWVEGMYDAGAKGCFDVLATHPYQAKAKPPSYPAPNDRQWWFQNISLVREVMLDHRDARTPVWFTEVGWSTHPGVVRKPGVTLKQQADYIEELYRFTAEHYPYVKRINWYQARDEPFGDLHRQNFGLFFLDLEPKPSARRLRNLSRP